MAHNLLAVVYALKGMPQEAIAEAERASSLAKGLWARITLGRVHATVGNHSEARAILTEVKQASKAPNLSHAAYCAMIHALLGEPDQAFEWLDKAFEEREPTLVYLGQLPGFENLHGDPRFGDLLRRIGLAA